jgi:hypothetical protein
MSSPPFVGSPTIVEFVDDPNVIFKAICKRVAYTLRVGLPGVIKTFNPVTQMCSVQLTITENIVINEVVKATAIDVLQDVLLMLPGDSNWCQTFPSLVGSECLVLFADMCVSAWSTNGPGATGVQNQEITRRHSLSDGFAILCPRSQPNVIPNYSTTAMEIRNRAGTVKLSMTDTEIVLTIGGETIVFSASNVTPSSPSFVVNSQLLANSLATTQTPTASTTGSNHSVPIVLNGVTYYMRLSSTP